MSISILSRFHMYHTRISVSLVLEKQQQQKNVLYYEIEYTVHTEANSKRYF